MARIVSRVALVFVTFILVASVLPATDSQECIIRMEVGDRFEYSPATNLESVITVTGDAMSSEGGFLEYDSSTGMLHGTAGSGGMYYAEIRALWEMDGLRQEALQEVVFLVSEPIPVTATAGQLDASDAGTEGQGPNSMLWLMVLSCLAGIAIGITVVRHIRTF